MATVIHIEAHVLEARTNLWCAHCSLPSVVELDLVLVNARTLRTFARTTRRACTDCDTD